MGAWARRDSPSGPGEHALADDGAPELHKREVQIRRALISDPQPAQVVKPREGSLHDPSFAAQTRPMVSATASDHGLHATRPQLTAVLVVVIASVREHPLGSSAWVSSPAPHRSDGVDQRQELGDIVAMSAREADRQRNAVRVGQQMML
jgi:hypothetical protein